MSHRYLLALSVSALLMLGGTAHAQTPPTPTGHGPNVSPHRHPNLAAAQRLMERADQRIVQAQRANEWDLDGHAARAKQLLEEAVSEMKAAAVAANHDRR